LLSAYNVGTSFFFGAKTMAAYAEDSTASVPPPLDILFCPVLTLARLSLRCYVLPSESQFVQAISS
jgi:hypothetical protein